MTESDPVCTHCHSRCTDFIYVDIDTMFFRILVSRVCCIKVQTQKYTELWTLWWFLDWNSWVCTSLYLYFVFFDLGPGNLPCLQQTLPAFKGHKTWMWEGENSKPRKEYGQRPQNFNVCSWGEGAGCTNHTFYSMHYSSNLLLSCNLRQFRSKIERQCCFHDFHLGLVDFKWLS